MKKYSIWFIVSIILIKIVYLIFESHYNADLIDIVSNPNTTKDILENLKIYGHRLSSIGLTLLMVPFLYLIVKKIITNKYINVASLIFLSILIYNLFYALLTFAIDEFVDRNKDIQHNSYYITLFKYGMLNKEIGYSSFIPKDRLENISIEDKVMISNIFLLLEADKNVIKKILDNKDLTVKSVLSNEENSKFKNNYKEAEFSFNKKLEDFHNKYNDYLTNSQKIDSEISIKDNEKELNRLYSNFQAKLQTQYKRYEENSNNLKKSLFPDDQTIDKHYKSLENYFKNQRYNRAKEEYNNTIRKEFGRYIEPKVFCEANICPSKNRIREVIKDEATNKFKNAYGDMNRSLSYIEFLKHPKIKNSVISELNKDGLHVTDDFNYSRKAFAEAYKNKINNELQEL